ncbi:hypothetical protein BCR41DRAFT_370365 [Lobosporangium transversale]|uniref:Uncharacterized protein n=1 Tax=Lobosporangium transversale TaxID=64571 RepID=A0A1Y2GTL7_9FUNG|nr:hypothetical protein BCR41DRAFT_370365 [Lobosporangium transversale]ORZ17553.1 hypothetical protein BCR41DRAFT_370365 [Lobosporangium transversale]|eukprot:XP_021881940.1 hypothetical protein BCR41DRAFT_370365 [Lobosporangium transversale]
MSSIFCRSCIVKENVRAIGTFIFATNSWLNLPAQITEFGESSSYEGKIISQPIKTLYLYTLVNCCELCNQIWLDGVKYLINMVQCCDTVYLFYRNPNNPDNPDDPGNPDNAVPQSSKTGKTMCFSG